MSSCAAPEWVTYRPLAGKEVTHLGELGLFIDGHCRQYTRAACREMTYKAGKNRQEEDSP